MFPFYLRRLVGELDAHLEQANWEPGVDLGGEPYPEVCVYLLRVYNGLHDLLAKVEREVAVLQQEPVALGDGELHELAGGLLLPLAHRELEIFLTNIYLPVVGKS